MVGPLELDRRNVAERFEPALAVVPRDPFERRELDVLDPFPRPAPMDLFRLEQPITVSASALSYESPPLPTDRSMPASANRFVYRIDRHWADSIGRRNNSKRRSCDGRKEEAPR